MKIKILKESSNSTFKLDPVGQTADDAESSPYPSDWDNDGWEPIDKTAEMPPEKKSSYQGPEVMLKAKGFENIERLGSGMVGTVYSADWKSGLEVAVKVVPRGEIKTHLPGGRIFSWSGEKEIRAYEGIKKAREQSENIAKHFPEVYAIMPDENNYYIFMERLTDEGPYTSVIDELFAGAEARIDPGKDLMDHGAWKDPSKRLFMYVKG